MALYEYFCDSCNHKFEQLTSSRDPDQGKCPKCHKKETRRLISRFAVSGRGDLRESTMHGCHDCNMSPGGLPNPTPEQAAPHAHEPAGHVHSASCGHGGGGGSGSSGSHSD
jgi:putative FmdB family regulatory protein